MTAISPPQTEAITLLKAWESANGHLLNSIRKTHLLDAVSLYIERERTESQSRFMSIFQELTNSLSAVRSDKAMPVYAELIEEWNRQNPQISIYPQAALDYNLSLARDLAHG